MVQGEREGGKVPVRFSVTLMGVTPVRVFLWPADQVQGPQREARLGKEISMGTEHRLSCLEELPTRQQGSD